MYSINKKSTRKRHVRKNKKTKRKVGKNTKKRIGKKNKQSKKRKIKTGGGGTQTYYWSPMRKLQFNPDLDSSLNDANRPRMDITDPVYNCKNPVTVIQTDQSGGAYVVGNNEQTVGNSEISTECPYQAQGASSYAYNYPPGLSNGLIIQNNDSQNGGGIKKVDEKTKIKKSNKEPFKRSLSRPENISDTIKKNFKARIVKYTHNKNNLIKTYPDKTQDIEVLMDQLIELCENVKNTPTNANYNNYKTRSVDILQELKTITNN